MPQKLLLPKAQYMASGIHIGMKQKTKDMREFVYKIRPDGLAVLNLKKIDERIKIAARFLARLNKILVATRKTIAFNIIKKFGEIIKAEVVTGRFMPGTLTNPSYKKYFEAEAVLILDPMTDIQALKEALKARVPVVAVCDTINETKDIDLIIPANNKGKKAIAMLFWLLAREILKERKEIKSDSEFKYKLEDFVGKEE
ncbi:MAG: 30S ribosomal protein S2 [Candidatus Aenigmatarchaeota archaeon]